MESRSKAFWISLLGLLYLLFPGHSASAQSCCAPRIGLTEKQIYASAEFAAIHAAPLPFKLETEQGTDITFPTQSGEPGHAYLIKSPNASRRWLIVVHEWWGLNDYIKREAERLRTELGDVNVLAVDLYDGKVATTPQEAQNLTGGVQPERLLSILQGAISYAGPKAKIASLGWCFGGGWALQSSILAGAQGIGTVMYYGMPEQDITKLEKLHGPVIAFFGSKDKFIDHTKEVQFKAAMRKAHRKLDTHTYIADHAFANPSNPQYNQRAAADANKKALQFLQRTLMRS